MLRARQRRWVFGRWGPCLVCGLALVASPLRPQSAASTAAASANTAGDLEVLRREIAGLETRLAALRDRESELSDRLAAIDLSLELQQKRTAEAVAARRLAAAAVAQAEQAVSDLETDLENARKALRRRLIGLYRLGRQGYLHLLLAAEPGADVLSSVRLVRFLARRDRQAIAHYESARDGLARKRDELEARRREVAEWTTQEAARGRALADLRRRQSEVLAAAAAERRAVATRAVDLAAREQRLSGLLDELYGASQAPLAGTAIQNLRGALEWPFAGRVTQGFGPRLDPRYRTTVPHHGIEIEPSGGRELRVIYPGKVLFAAPLEGYGPTVVVLHAGKVFSLYAGLSELRVKKGDVLSLGQPLGVVADRLYFELRVENRPEDPLSWLR